MLRPHLLPPEQTLIDAARQYAARVTGRKVARIVLMLDDGSKRKIDLPACNGADWPPLVGWSIKGDRGSFNGVDFKLTGKLLSVYRALVEAGTDGIDAADLQTEIWDEHTEMRTVENTVARLRQAIKVALDLEDEADPIIVENKRYQLSGGFE